MELVVEHPRVPYIGLVLGSVAPGKWLKIRGIAPLGAFRFSIQLQCSSNIIIQDNVALQFSVNFQNNNISLNSKQNGKWDEAQTVFGIPIKYEERFELAITSDFSHYKIFFNSEQCYELSQRITYDRISHIVIDGDVSVEQVSYESELSSLETSVCLKYDDAPPPYNDMDSKAFPIYAMNFGSTIVRIPSIPPYSTVPTLPRYSPYPVQPAIYAAGAETATPLNDTFSHFHLVLSPNRKKCSIYICLLLLLSVLVGASLLAKSRS